MTSWPKQSECDAFYGNPRGRGGAQVNQTWYKENIVLLDKLPFRMAMGDIKITRFPLHKKCIEATREWLEAVWQNAGKDQRVIDQWGMIVFSGSFNYRPMRGMNALSMHAYGIAIDFDAPRNALGDATPHFATVYEPVVAPFVRLGGTWGGQWKRPDGMHFQWAQP